MNLKILGNSQYIANNHKFLLIKDPLLLCCLSCNNGIIVVIKSVKKKTVRKQKYGTRLKFKQ
jgi:hypothetical protein